MSNLHKSIVKDKHKHNKWVVNYMNKDKNFQPDKKIFTNFDYAVRWAKKNLDNYEPDMITSEDT